MARLALAVALALALALGAGGSAGPFTSSPAMAAPAEPAPVEPAPSTSPAAAPLPAWSGGVSLYRAGAFTTQQTWYWCTAAGVQIARNIVRREADHAASTQGAYFDWMRGHNEYDIPVKDGVDPAGWAAGMAHFVDRRYRVASDRTFDAALRRVVTSLRLTYRPVPIAVMHGNHAWLVVGFTATADPAVTRRFRVTSVRVVGPLYGLQSKNGYDMKPNTKLTPGQLQSYVTPFHYAAVEMPWEGRYLTIEPAASWPGTVANPTPNPTPRPAAIASPRPAATASPRPAPTAAPTVTPAATPMPTATPRPTPSPTPAAPAPATPALASPAPVVLADVAPTADGVPWPGALLVLGIVLLAAVATRLPVPRPGPGKRP